MKTITTTLEPPSGGFFMSNRMEIIEDATSKIQEPEFHFELMEDDEEEAFNLDDYLNQLDVEFTD